MNEHEKDREIHNREEIREDSSDLVASGTARSKKSWNALTSETVDRTSWTESRCGTSKDLDFAEVSDNSSILVSAKALNEISHVETRCSGAKDDDLVDISGSSSNGVASAVVSENTLSLVTSDNVIEIRSSDNRCDIGKDLELDELGDNSLDLVPSTAAGNENSSDLVSSKTLHEIRCADSGCSTGKDDNLQRNSGNSSNSETLEIVIEVRCTEAECTTSKDGMSNSKTDVLEGKQMDGNKMKVDLPDPVRGSCVMLNVMGGDGGLDSEKVCRICHLNSERGLNASDMIQLGCDCKDELGIAHRHCAETWFKLKGNRWCEICGESAKNITGVGDNSFMEMWNDRVIAGIGTRSYSERGRFWRCQPFGNFLLACLVIAFILPWFFRVNMF